MGKLFVIEGTDASGKSTQFQILSKRLSAEGVAFKPVVFPRYDHPSSSLLRMYLHGDFGKDPGDVNPYTASTFYAVDRIASYLDKEGWGAYYRSGGLVVTDRYITSNAVHQAPKLPEEEQRDFMDWLIDFECGKLGLPKPDGVVLLDMPPRYVRSLLSSRPGSRDIHEQSLDYLEKCYNAAHRAAEWYGWQLVPCVADGKLRPVEEIAADIYGRLSVLL